jgi:hypothetical protein
METKQYVKGYIIDHGLVAKAAKIDASDPDVRPDLRGHHQTLHTTACKFRTTADKIREHVRIVRQGKEGYRLYDQSRQTNYIALFDRRTVIQSRFHTR